MIRFEIAGRSWFAKVGQCAHQRYLRKCSWPGVIKAEHVSIEIFLLTQDPLARPSLTAFVKQAGKEPGDLAQGIRVDGRVQRLEIEAAFF